MNRMVTKIMNCDFRNKSDKGLSYSKMMSLEYHDSKMLKALTIIEFHYLTSQQQK
jgi:hypothetical protein